MREGAKEGDREGGSKNGRVRVSLSKEKRGSCAQNEVNVQPQSNTHHHTKQTVLATKVVVQHCY